MYQGLGILIAYSAAVVFASVVGGLLPEWIRLTHQRMQLMISMVGGLMLGIAVFHMVPHALVAVSGNSDWVAWGIMVGLIVTFFLLRFFHFHQHGPADFGLHAAELRLAAERAQQEIAAEPTHLCSEHVQPTKSSHCGSPEHSGPARWILVLVGLGMHTLTDGIALASGVMSEAHGLGHSMLPGLGIFLAVLLHKPLDAVSITSLMYPVTSPNLRLAINVGFAMMCPVGAILFWFGVGGLSPTTIGWASGFALAFSAGVFLCIALSDLLPEMEFHSHSRIPLSLALLVGIASAWAIGLLEGEHAHHNHAPPAGEESSIEHGSPDQVLHQHHDHAH